MHDVQYCTKRRYNPREDDGVDAAGGGKAEARKRVSRYPGCPGAVAVLLPEAGVAGGRALLLYMTGQRRRMSSQRLLLGANEVAAGSRRRTAFRRGGVKAGWRGTGGGEQKLR